MDSGDGSGCFTAQKHSERPNLLRGGKLEHRLLFTEQIVPGVLSCDLFGRGADATEMRHGVGNQISNFGGFDISVAE